MFSQFFLWRWVQNICVPPKLKRRTRAVASAASTKPCVESLEPRALLSTGSLPRPDHVVIVIEENHSFEQIQHAHPPYLTALERAGALFTDSHGIKHPSQPNYLALFSGSTQRVHGDSTPRHLFHGPDLGSELIAAGYTFAGYSEGLPSLGFKGSRSGNYVRRHNPWVDFMDVPGSANLPLTSLPSDFSQLRTVSFIVPNLENDMHSGSIEGADDWLKQHVDAYVQWAQSHNSLLIVTWDESNLSSSVNHIPTIFVGPMVKPGQYSETINHYNVLRTLEDMYGLPAAGESANVSPITDAFTTG
jgi:phosphatidylinositol-3-phosphatase